MNAKEWIQTHVVATAAIGAVIVLGGSGAAAAAVITAPTFQQQAEAQSDNQANEPTSAPGDTPAPAFSETFSPGTTNGGGGSTGQGSTQPNTGSDSQPNSPAAPPAEEPAPPAPLAAPDAPSGVSVSPDGAGNVYVSWNASDGADHYWVDVVDAAYSHGDRQSPIYGTSIGITPAADTNCVYLAAVSADGTQSDVTGPYCW